MTARSARKAATAAAMRQLLKAELGWLRGYPERRDALGVVWTAHRGVGSARGVDTVTVTRAHVARATRSLREIGREHGRALDDVVGDFARWSRHVTALLERIKPAVAGREDVHTLRAPIESIGSARLVKKLHATRQGHPSLSREIDALAWLLSLEPERLNDALSLLAEWAPRLVRLGAKSEGPSGVTMRLLELGVTDGAALVAPMLDALCDEVVVGTPLTSGPSSAAALPAVLRGSRKKWPPLPKARMASELQKLFDWLTSQPKTPRRAALALWARLGATEVAHEWARFHDKRRTLQQRAERAALSRSLGTIREASERLARELADLESAPPAGVVEDELLDQLRVAAGWSTSTVRAAVGALDGLPPLVGRWPVRIAMFTLWCKLISSGTKEPDAAHWIRSTARFITHRKDDARAALEPWANYLAADAFPTWRAVSTLDYRVLALGRSSRAQFWHALEGSVSSDEVQTTRYDRARFDLLVTLVELTSDGRRALDLLRSMDAAALTSQDASPARVCVATALTLCRHDDASFAALVKALGAAGLERFALTPDDGLALGEIARDEDAAAGFRRAVLRGDARELAALGTRMLLLAQLGAPSRWRLLPRFAPADAGWTTRYPARLVPLLCALASVDPHAEATARRAFGKTMRSRESLALEMTSVASTLDGTGLSSEMRRRLQQRSRNLERRFADPVTLKATTLAKLERRLELLLEKSTLVAWRERLDRELGRLLAPALGLQELPPWALEEPAIELLPHLFALTPPHDKKLALRVLRARAGPYPWDLRDEGANAAFVAALEKKGIDMAPWLDGIGVLATDTPRGPVLMQLERDPLETLLMGKHFDTCLKPGAFNFFSAVVNAADINKRVLYLRDAQGTVIGRCLLALTVDGTIVAFHPYCHDPEGFEMSANTARFVDALARAMRTVVAVQGRVNTLLSRDWYDDGPIDVTGSLAPFSAGSSMRNWLGRARPEDLASGLCRELAPLAVDALTLPLLLELSEIRQRPELAVPLLDEAERCPELPLASRGRALVLAWSAGAHERVARFAAQHVAPLLDRKTGVILDHEALLLMVEIGHASAVLRHLARTRARGVRSVADEADGWRTFTAARAHEALYRRRLAASLYRILLRQRGARALAQACRERLAALR